MIEYDFSPNSTPIGDYGANWVSESILKLQKEMQQVWL